MQPVNLDPNIPQMSQPKPKEKPQKVVGAKNNAGQNIEVTAKRIDSRPVDITIDHGDGFCTNPMVEENRRQRITDAFLHLRAELVQGQIVEDDKIVRIDTHHEIVWIYNADGTGAKSKNLKELIDQEPGSELAKSANDLIRLARKVLPNAPKRPEIDRHCKAPKNASAKPSSGFTKEIEKDYSPCAKAAMQIYCAHVTNPKKQEEALRRVAAAESIISQMQKTIDRELQTHRENLPNAGQKKEATEKAIEELSPYEKMNRLGLYVAVAFAEPDLIDQSDAVKALNNANYLAGQIESVLQAHLDSIHKEEACKDLWLPEVFPDSIRGTPNPFIQKDETYAKWAAALAYSMLPEELARKGASSYWSREKSESYKDSVEDDLLRFVVKKAKDANATVETPLLDAMFATVKKHDSTFSPTLAELKAGVSEIFNANLTLPEDMDAKIKDMKDRYRL